MEAFISYVNYIQPSNIFFFPLLIFRFWCKPDSYKPDENFLAMSKDAVQYFLVGWKKKWLQFHGKITLGLNIGMYFFLL